MIGPAAEFAVAFLGITLCVIWWFHVHSFSTLYKAKFDVLREMETGLPFPCYGKETKFLGIATPKPKFRVLNQLERYVILALTIPFVVILIHSVLRSFSD